MIKSKTNPLKLSRFFFLSFLISWSVWGIGLLIDNETKFVFFPIGAWGPALAAIILSSRDGNLGEMVSTIKPHQIPPKTVLAMLILAPLAMMIPLLQFPISGENIPSSFIFNMLPKEFSPWYFVAALPILFPLLMVGNLGEEIGWRGFALEPLGERFGYARGSVVLGILNAFWHTPLYWLIDNPIYNPFSLMFVGFLLFEIGYTLFLTSMWLKVRQSIFVGLIVHTSVTVGSLFLPTWGLEIPILLSGILMILFALPFFMGRN